MSSGRERQGRVGAVLRKETDSFSTAEAMVFLLGDGLDALAPAALLLVTLDLLAFWLALWLAFLPAIAAASGCVVGDAENVLGR